MAFGERFVLSIGDIESIASMYLYWRTETKLPELFTLLFFTTAVVHDA